MTPFTLRVSPPNVAASPPPSSTTHPPSRAKELFCKISTAIVAAWTRCRQDRSCLRFPLPLYSTCTSHTCRVFIPPRLTSLKGPFSLLFCVLCALVPARPPASRPSYCAIVRPAGLALSPLFMRSLWFTVGSSRNFGRYPLISHPSDISGSQMWTNNLYYTLFW